MKKLLLIAILPILFLACGETSSDRIIENFTAETGQIVQDIPGILQSDGYNKMKQHLEESLRLTSLKNGFDEFQIRIWEADEPFSGNLYLFKNLLNAGWSGEFYQYYYTRSQSGKMDSVIGKKFMLPKPKSGWNSFINRLYGLDILTLPHWQSIRGYDQEGTSEGGVAIEIASKTKYRIYAYLTPYSRQEYFPQAKKIVQIMKLIKREFN